MICHSLKTAAWIPVDEQSKSHTARALGLAVLSRGLKAALCTAWRGIQADASGLPKPVLTSDNLHSR
jgi:hypothetical protein